MLPLNHQHNLWLFTQKHRLSAKVKAKFVYLSEQSLLGTW